MSRDECVSTSDWVAMKASQHPQVVGSGDSIQIAPKRIAHIQFGTLTKNEMERVAEFQVISRDLFTMPQRLPATNGCMDPRLGVSDKASSCKTCGKNISVCAGHFGWIKLELPVFHAGFFKHSLTILQCICKTCSRVLLPNAARANHLKKFRSSTKDALEKAAEFKRVVDKCKREQKCPYCDAPNGVVKKIGGGCFRIVHEINRSKYYEEVEEKYNKIRDEVSRNNPELKSCFQKKSTELLSPLRVYELFSQICREDMTILWMDETFGSPETLIFWSIPVPPVPIRPSVPQESGGGSTEDDITIKLQEIIEINNVLKTNLDKGATMKMVAEEWEILQTQVALFINGETPGIPRHLMGSKAIRGLSQRLKGKQGRFRGNLSGKRVDFSGRTVISPDPNLQVDQVGVPIYVAKVMTYPEKVNRYNIEKLRRYIINGPDKHPGANMVRIRDEQTGREVTKSLMFASLADTANSLKYGDIVERHMNDDDIVLFNRQPSLHKMSIMAHKVRVMPWRTFRFNECVCSPYNADFDGDEMNMHLPQTEEARAEASELMSVRHNLITPRNGEPLVAATQDFLTAAYLMTQKDVFYSREEFCHIVTYLFDAEMHVEIPPPVILKPLKLWTGKQVMNLLVAPNKKSTSLVNLHSEEKFYTSDKHFCIKDGYVCFRNGEHISGALGKKTLGGESKSGLFYVLIRDYGSAIAIKCMSRLAKLASRFLCDRGFSIGIEDVTPSERMSKLKFRLIGEGQKLAEEQIEAYKSGVIKLKPGCNALQSLESEVNGLLGRVRSNCGDEAVVTLNRLNAALCMSQCGSKGSPLNISQMVACLGQQSVGGMRVQDGFVNRTLPHFPVGSLSPAAKGFVANSFFSGLLATEFFFHTMGGREGLVDTAVKTAETGYMARRLMKALEDLSMQYDMTVRNSEKTVIQFKYGDDGLNPQLMEKGDRPVNFKRLLINAISSESPHDREHDEPLSSSELRELVCTEMNGPKLSQLKDDCEYFFNEIQEFFFDFSKELEKIERIISVSNPRLVKNTLSSIRTRLSRMNQRDKIAWRNKASKENTQEQVDAHRLLCNNCMRITAKQFHTIVDGALMRNQMAHIVPGEAVGAVGAQSLSEPGTQMTLKTFHFAGVASMNVTLGVPRLKEIINAAKLISTPIIEARLVNSTSQTSARIAKAKIEKTTLGEVSVYIREVYTRNESYVSIKLNKDTIDNLHLQLDARRVKASILHTTPGVQKPSILRGLKEHHIQVQGEYKLHIIPPEAKDGKGLSPEKKTYFIIQQLKSALPNVIVQGIPTVSRAVINEETVDNDKHFYLLVEGYGLADVIGCPGIDGCDTKSNHIIEMQQVLGIEAARYMISSEIKYIMSAYGITVDRRHLMLLSDVMTFKGEILGITRFGVAKMRESVLMLASFEKTTDHLFDAAVHSRQDSIVGVSECIIMGVPIPIGTGIFKLVHQPMSEYKLKTRIRLLETI